MEGLSLGLGTQEVNIIMGLKDNKECRALPPVLEEMLIKYFNMKGTMSIGILDSVYTKEEFSDAVNGGQYQMGIILEKIKDSSNNDTPIGQGAIKQWKKANPDMRIILIMDEERYATGKVQGLYDRGIYDGLFQSDFGREPLLDLIDHPRNMEEAYVYYGLQKYKEEEAKKAKEKEELSAAEKEIVLEPVIIGTKTKKPDVSVIPAVSDMETQDMEEPKLPAEEVIPIVNGVREDNSVSDDNKEQDKSHKVEVNKEDSSPAKQKETLKEKNEPVPEKEFEGLVFDSATSKDKSSESSAEPADKKESAPAVITKAKTVNTKDVLSFINDEAMVEKYLKKVADTLKQPANIHKTNVEDNPLYGTVLNEYAYMKVEKLNRVLIGVEDKESFLAEVFDFLNDYDADADEKGYAFERFQSFAFGYECLEQLIDMDDVLSIHVIDYNNIRVKKKNGRATANISFLNNKYYLGFIDNLLQRNIRSVVKEGLVTHFTDRNFSDKYMLSVSVFDSSVYSGKTKELIIKKSIKETRMIEDLIGSSLSMRAAAVLVHAAQKRRNILLCGPRGSGVMQMMQILLNYIPLDKNGIILQHRDELTASKHPELLVRQPIMQREEEKDGVKVIIEGHTLAQFAESALQRDVDYYILSDARGAEVDSFYKAMNYGFTVWTTIKAVDCEGALLALTDSVMANSPDYNRNDVARTIADKFDYVVYMEKFKVLRIAQVDRDSYSPAAGTFNLTTIESYETNEV